MKVGSSLLGSTALALALLACSSSPESSSAETTGTDEIVAEPGPSASAPRASQDSGADRAPAPPAVSVAPAPEAPKPVTVDDVLVKLRSCRAVSTAPYKTDVSSSTPANISVCGTTGGLHFTADMDIDCDGKPSSVCNSSTDPSFQAQTAGTDSKGAPLDASKLPYVVVPGESSRFSYVDAGLEMGSVVLVIYDGKMTFGVVGDVGPTSIVGEASYAMAKELGINPDPAVGGTSSGVTYLFFTGPSAKVKKLEDRAEALRLGEALLASWYAKN